MADIVAEKIFEHFLEFPEEVRLVVINAMEPDDRCRFTRSSKLSQKEARKCKNFIYGLNLSVSSVNYIFFHVFYTKTHENNKCDYSLYFCRSVNGNKYIKYVNPVRGELWKTQLDNSTNLKQYAYEKFKHLLNLYQNTIKMLEFSVLENHDFGVNSLSNLEILTLGYKVDLQQFISKIRKPLKELVCFSPMSYEFAAHYEQIYEVQDFFKVSKIHLNYEQFLKLSARNIYIDIGNMTEENIYDFIDSWRNDKLRSSFQYCQWFHTNSKFKDFDINKLLRLLGSNENVMERQPRETIPIKHNNDVRKMAEFGFDHWGFDFSVINQ